MTSIRQAIRRVMSRSGEKGSSFRLDYTPVGGRRIVVGHLRFQDGVWSFEYDPSYRRRSDLRPIEGFDEMSKVYRSRSLFPFFSVRVPDKDRPDVRLRLKQQRVDDPDTSDLLRMFGRRAAASPAFELVEE